MPSLKRQLEDLLAELRRELTEDQINLVLRFIQLFIDADRLKDDSEQQVAQ